MYVLQMNTSKDSSVVLGCYDTMSNMKDAAQNHKDQNNTTYNHYFYDYKEVNALAEWDNYQEAVWL